MTLTTLSIGPPPECNHRWERIFRTSWMRTDAHIFASIEILGCSKCGVTREHLHSLVHGEYRLILGYRYKMERPGL